MMRQILEIELQLPRRLPCCLSEESLVQSPARSLSLIPFVAIDHDSVASRKASGTPYHRDYLKSSLRFVWDETFFLIYFGQLESALLRRESNDQPPKLC